MRAILLALPVLLFLFHVQSEATILSNNPLQSTAVLPPPLDETSTLFEVRSESVTKQLRGLSSSPEKPIVSPVDIPNSKLNSSALRWLMLLIPVFGLCAIPIDRRDRRATSYFERE